MRTLLEVIDEYDYAQRARIAELEKEVAELRRANGELLGLSLAGIRERERLMLKAIIAGAFDRKEEPVTP